MLSVSDSTAAKSHGAARLLSWLRGVALAVAGDMDQLRGCLAPAPATFLGHQPSPSPPRLSGHRSVSIAVFMVT